MEAYLLATLTEQMGAEAARREWTTTGPRLRALCEVISEELSDTIARLREARP